MTILIPAPSVSIPADIRDALACTSGTPPSASNKIVDSASSISGTLISSSNKLIDAAVAGTSATAVSAANKLVDNADTRLAAALTAGRWITGYSQDFTSLANQNLFPDGGKLINGFSFYFGNNAGDRSGMAIVNGSGIRMQPVAGTNYTTMPFFHFYIQTLLSSAVWTRKNPVRCLVNITKAGTSETTTYCCAGFNLGNIFESPAYAFRAGISATGRPAYQYTNSISSGAGPIGSAIFDGYGYSSVEFPGGFFAGRGYASYFNSETFSGTADVMFDLIPNTSVLQMTNVGSFSASSSPLLSVIAGSISGGGSGGSTFYIKKLILQYMAVEPL